MRPPRHQRVHHIRLLDVGGVQRILTLIERGAVEYDDWLLPACVESVCETVVYWRVLPNRPEANYPRLITASSAALNILGKGFPCCSALRMIPSHASALKEYFCGAVRSKTSDKVDTPAALRNRPSESTSLPVWNSGKLAVQNSP